MTSLFDLCPAAPDWRVHWDAIAEHECIRALAGCPQDPVHHAEGDVGIHTRMVCAELAGLPAWRALSEPERRLLFAAAVLHDAGKPDCTRAEDSTDRITSRGHSRRGAILARALLWRQGTPFAVRELIAGLVRYHQVPYFLIDRPDARKLCLEVSVKARCDLLSVLAEADVRGRVCQDKQRLLDNVGLFAEYAREAGCWAVEYPFPSDHTRVVYFREEGRSPAVPVQESFRADVVLMAGFPGAGKDHHIRTHLADWPVVSLDTLRGALDVDPEDDQGAVVNAARQQARDHLRKGQRFVWNSTNVSRQRRVQTLNLLLGYQARVRIVYLETPPEVLLVQNRQRQGPALVPQRVIERLLERWEVPDRTEAHRVDWLVRY
jgi:predicted kinase